jgi:hypothetical protein
VILSQAAQSLNVLYILNIYTEYLTIIIFNNEIIQKILTVYVKNISNLLIEYICCVSESTIMDKSVNKIDRHFRKIQSNNFIQVPQLPHPMLP